MIFSHAGRARLLFGACVMLVAGCGSGSETPQLDPQALRDPTACMTCHPDQYNEWSGSMHAYSSDDPVFRAMNQRAQRETGNALGTFCLKCHAPMAVRQNLTTDGSNLDQLPQASKGVTCYFCHATESVDGTHNNPLTLATDNSLFGPFSDPIAGMPHQGKYSRLFDDTQVESANTCGACHDIVNLQNAHVERTFQEWQDTLFATPPRGSTCIPCHMNGRDGNASTVAPKTRRLHSHAFPGVDLALTPLPNMDVQRQGAQDLLDTTVQTSICVKSFPPEIEVIMDNVGAGHGFPSGATPDRRAWVELTAYAGGDVIYSSGGAAAAPLDDSPDPDLWLMRDCIFDASGAPVEMFWQAVTVADPSGQLPGSILQVVSMPATFSKTHILKTYPGPSSPPLAQMPDRITVAVHLQAIGDDVLADLVASGDLDPSLPPNIARYDLGGGAMLEWTPAAAISVPDQSTGLPKPCVTTMRAVATMTTTATSHAKCVAAQ
jgi:hypothetical protein